MKGILTLLTIALTVVIAQSACPEGQYCYMNGDQVLAILRLTAHPCQNEWTYELHSPLLEKEGNTFIIAEKTLSKNVQEHEEQFGAGTGFVYYVKFHGASMTNTSLGFESSELTIPAVQHDPFVSGAYSVPINPCGQEDEIYLACSIRTDSADDFTIDRGLFSVLTDYTPDSSVVLSSSNYCPYVLPGGAGYEVRHAPLFCPRLEFVSCSENKDTYFTSYSGLYIEPILIDFEHRSQPEVCSPFTDRINLCIFITTAQRNFEEYGHDVYWYIYVYYYVSLRDTITGETIAIQVSSLSGEFPICGLYDCHVKPSHLNSEQLSYISELESIYFPPRTYSYIDPSTWESSSDSEEFFTSFISSLESSLSSFVSSLLSSLFGSSSSVEHEVSSAVSSFVSSVKDDVKEEEEHHPYLAYLFVLVTGVSCVASSIVFLIVVIIVFVKKQATPTSREEPFEAVSEKML